MTTKHDLLTWQWIPEKNFQLLYAFCEEINLSVNQKQAIHKHLLLKYISQPFANF